MSKVSIQGDISGTGDFTIKAPNSNVDRTLTLRDETGDLVTTATDLEPQVKDSLNATGSASVYACRAWVNFDGTGTVSIRESGNVSSITDLRTGNYRINFSTAMTDNDYCMSSAVSRNDSATKNILEIGSFSSNEFDIATRTADTGTRSDTEIVCCSVFR